MSTSSVLCACGRPLHYTSEIAELYVRVVIANHGETLEVTTSEGTWKVQRHYIALHGLKASELPELAHRYGWEKVLAN